MKFFSSKSRVALVIAAFAVTLSSCEDDLLKINIPLIYEELEFTIPASDSAGTFTDVETVETDIDSILNKNEGSRDKINSIKIKSLTLTILNGDSATNFRILQSVAGGIQAGNEGYKEVGSVTDNPDEIKYELTIPVNGEELKSYVSQNTFTFTITGTTRVPIPYDVQVKAKLNFDAVAGFQP